MNINAIKQIYNFNKEAGLLEAGYIDERECAFPIEEALEGFDVTQIAADVSYYQWKPDTPKQFSRDLLWGSTKELPDVDRLDKHLDIIVFSFGSIFKLGLTPQQAMRALSVVMSANMQKLQAGQDSEGKQQKPTDFIGPEKALQRILDERSSDGL